MTKEIKIYQYISYGDSAKTTQFGTEQSLKDWKEEQLEWEEEGFSTYDDSIECIGSVTPDAAGIEKLMDLIPSFEEEL